MCWCRPNVRTPNCGGIDCHPPIALPVVGVYDNREVWEKGPNDATFAEIVNSHTHDVSKCNCRGCNFVKGGDRIPNVSQVNSIYDVSDMD